MLSFIVFFLHIFVLRHALRFLDRIWLICFPQVSVLTMLCCCFLIISHIKFLFDEKAGGVGGRLN